MSDDLVNTDEFVTNSGADESGTTLSDIPTTTTGTLGEPEGATPSSTVVPETSVAPIELIDAPIESPDEVCQIPENWNKPPSHNINTGFPVVLDRLQSSGLITVSVIPVEWDDFPSSDSDLDHQFEQVKIFADYYNKASKGAVTFELKFVDHWTVLPGSINDYPQENPSDFNPQLVQAAVDAVDDEFDFSGTDYLIVIVPDSAPIPLTGFAPTTEIGGGGNLVINHGSFQQNATDDFVIRTQEGDIDLWMGAGAYFDGVLGRKNEWSYYVHEAGHSFEIADYYVIGEEGWWYSPWEDVEPAWIPNGPFNYWDVMGSQDGPSRTFNAWSRWLLGWLSSEEVACYDARNAPSNNEFDIALTPIDRYTGAVRAIIIRTEEHRGIVIESRRPEGPDETLQAWSDVGVDPSGVLVYEVDTTKRTTEGPLRIIPPDGHFWVEWTWTYTNPGRHLDALYHDGDTTTIGDTSITVRQIGEDTDVVRIQIGT